MQQAVSMSEVASRGVSRTFCFGIVRFPTLQHRQAHDHFLKILFLLMFNNAGAYGMTYNGEEMVSETTPQGLTVGYSYDNAHDLTKITDSQGGMTSWSYGANNEVVAESYSDASNNLSVNYGYDLGGEVTSETRFSSLLFTTTVSFEQIIYNGDEISGITDSTGSGTLLASFGYVHNNNGWLASEFEASGTPKNRPAKRKLNCSWPGWWLGCRLSTR